MAMGCYLNLELSNLALEVLDFLAVGALAIRQLLLRKLEVPLGDKIWAFSGG